MIRMKTQTTTTVAAANSIKRTPSGMPETRLRPDRSTRAMFASCTCAGPASLVAGGRSGPPGDESTVKPAGSRLAPPRETTVTRPWSRTSGRATWASIARPLLSQAPVRVTAVLAVIESRATNSASWPSPPPPPPGSDSVTESCRCHVACARVAAQTAQLIVASAAKRADDHMTSPGRARAGESCARRPSCSAGNGDWAGCPTSVRRSP